MLARVDVVSEGRLAWQRLQERQRTSWSEWRAVGEALKLGRETALRGAATDRPYGKRYTAIFGDWLIAQGFDGMTKACRYRLLMCLDNIDAIERFRAGLPEGLRAKYGHPDSVWFAWRNSQGLPTRKYHAPDRPGIKPRCDGWVGRPSGDMVKRIAGVIRQNWTTDTYRLALVVIEATARDPSLAEMFVKPVPNNCRKPRPAVAELRA